MKHFILLCLSVLSFTKIWAADISVKITHDLLGRDYVIAARVEKVSQPMKLGNMKVYAGLRVYNPQIVRFALAKDSLTITAGDPKKGPQQVCVPIIKKEDDCLQVEMDAFFKEILKGVDVLSGKQQLGHLDETKTQITFVRGDANHFEVSVTYTYETKDKPFTITIRKSLLLLEQAPMVGRPTTPLLGYKSTNGKDINRFNLNKQQQITFYISDAFAPLWQEALQQGIEDWNIAFRRIGHPQAIKAMKFSDAGKDFDPFDIHNNCIYKIDSDFANAQGNHWVDPRSGEILQADVLMYSGVTEKLKTWLLLQTGAYNKNIADGMVSDSIMKRMLRYAIAHEIGHCLGLEHNYRASFAYPTDSLRNPAFCAINGTTPSIMDYARFNYVAQKGDGVTAVYPPILGDYDLYAIEAGYGNFTNTATYLAFIQQQQASPRYRYTKLKITTLPTDEAVQPTDLGNDQLSSTRYGIKNIAALPSAVLQQLKAKDVHQFYFQLLMHTIPCLERPEVKSFLETELNQGYKMLNSDKMRKVYGDQSEAIEQLRCDFITKVRKQYPLDITSNPLSTGMWTPNQMVTDDVFSLLKKDGIRLSKSDIYSINKRCATGAALSMSVENGASSPFASASFVSKDGLVLTNFHCVSNYVQRLAKGNNDYMRYGCWATKREEEAPLFNLQVHQVLSVEDVTQQVLAGTENLCYEERDRQVDKQARTLMNNANIEHDITQKVYSMMGGQQYILVRYRTFKDVRIVACPPMWLGAYGGDADNWKWPRYSCDFAFLRVYVSPEGTIANYSKENIAYHPKSYLRIAKEKIKNDDFVMVMGYPSQTRKNIPAFALDKIVFNDTQLRVNALKAKIDFLTQRKQNATGIALSAYDVRIGKLNNVYLRSKSEIEGVRNLGLVESKRKEDLQLQEWINDNEDRKAKYGSQLIEQMDSVYALLTPYNHMDEAFSQFVGSGAGIFPFAGKFEKLLAIDRAKRRSRAKDMQMEIQELRRNIREFFPSINMKEDCGMMKTLLPIYLKEVDKKYLPKELQTSVDMDYLYATSLLTDSARLEKYLDESIEKGTAQLANDTLYRLCIGVYINRVQKQNKESTPLRRLNTKLYTTYMQAKTEKNKGTLTAYDANHTLRFSPGRIMATNNVADMLQREDYLSPRFKQHLQNCPTPPIACFTTNAETAAGNSGSAVLNAKGEIVGLNFDRTAQSTFSIYHNDPLLTRNIVVSLDYILWVIKNLSYSQYILPELGARL